MAAIPPRRVNQGSASSASSKNSFLEERYAKIDTATRPMMQFLDKAHRKMRLTLDNRARSGMANMPLPDNPFPTPADPQPVFNYKLSDLNLDRLGVKLEAKPLALDQATALVQPISLSAVTAWLEESQPWTKRGWGDGADEYRLFQDYYNATSLSNNLVAYVSVPAIDTPEKKAIQLHARYDTRLTNLWKARGNGCQTFMYSVGRIYERHAATSCTLVQDTVLTDDCLTLPEMMAMYNLTLLRTVDGISKCIPVTVISFGGSTGRVLHGHIDPIQPAIHVAKSRVMDFSKEGSFAHDEWKYLICWLFAVPIDE